jgi:glycosyltransferase involved in cell wall biosynthesis
MKYLVYTETFPSRDPASPRQTGIGRYCHDLASGLTSLGQDVLVVTNSSIGPVAAGTEEPFRVIAHGEEPTASLARLRRGAEVARISAAESPDVILVGDPGAHRVCSRFSSRLLGRCWPIYYGTELLGLEPLLRRPGVSPARWLRGVATRRYLGKVAGRICISRYTANLLRRVTPGRTADCIVYPTASELVLHHSSDPRFSGELRCRIAGEGEVPAILLTVARISERKNQLGVLEAIALLHRSSRARFHYLVVGNVDSPQHAGYLDSMRAYVRENGLERSVTLVSNASDEEKVAYLDACDVFVMLSRTVGSSVEGFGISVVEASCRGKPVVVSDEGGMPETVLDGQTGYAVPPADTGAVAAALEKLALDPALRTRMGGAGREFARREFTPLASARRLHDHLVTRLTPSDR